MPNTETVRRQRAIGGALGVAVLAFALFYHFFPQALHVHPTQNTARTPLRGQPSVMGFDQRPQAAPQAVASEIDAGPPIMLAPASVIAARHREKSADIVLPAQKTLTRPSWPLCWTAATRPWRPIVWSAVGTARPRSMPRL